MFENLFPSEAANPHTRVVRPSTLLKERGAKWFDYGVGGDGILVLGEGLPGQGHPNLALGRKVRAAAHVRVSGGIIVEIDNSSRHYLPKGRDARDAALEAFRKDGFPVPDHVYIEKGWNETTQLWEPIRGTMP